MKKSVWASKNLRAEHIFKLHEPRAFAKAFGLKVPLTFCSNEDCVYKQQPSCPAGSLKGRCPNRSILDHKNGCYFYIGKPYQACIIRESISGRKQIYVIITGRGTGKTSVIDTQKAIMEATIEPYIRGMLFKCDRPVPTKVIVVGNTKDTAILLRNSIHAVLESNELLYSMVSDDTKTYLRFHNGSEIFIRTAGTDGRTVRGFHADMIRNRYGDDVPCTIAYIFDEACFARARSMVSEVMRPSLQIGNAFSNIFITSTPWGRSGEIFDMFENPGNIVGVFNLASFHNKYTNIEVIFDFRNRLERAGMSAIYNREVLGVFQSEEGLFFPFNIWSKSIDDSIDWVTYDEIKKHAEEGFQYSGKYYLGLDPNKFRQLEHGDFSAYLLVQVSKNREHIRAISFGKYLMDIEDQFLNRVKDIVKVFRPTVVCCANSGYLSVLRQSGIDVIPGSNQSTDLIRSMSLAKIDMVHGVYRQPSSQEFEDERRSYIPKEPGERSNIPRLDHEGTWGQGYTSDLMDCMSFIYQQIIEDYGLGSIPTPGVSSISSGLIGVPTIKEYESIVLDSAKKMRMFIK